MNMFRKLPLFFAVCTVTLSFLYSQASAGEPSRSLVRINEMHNSLDKFAEKQNQIDSKLQLMRNGKSPTNEFINVLSINGAEFFGGLHYFTFEQHVYEEICNHQEIVGANGGRICNKVNLSNILNPFKDFTWSNRLDPEYLGRAHSMQIFDDNVIFVGPREKRVQLNEAVYIKGVAFDINLYFVRCDKYCSRYFYHYQPESGQCLVSSEGFKFCNFGRYLSRVELVPSNYDRFRLQGEAIADILIEKYMPPKFKSHVAREGSGAKFGWSRSEYIPSAVLDLSLTERGKITYAISSIARTKIDFYIRRKLDEIDIAKIDESKDSSGSL